MTPSPLPSLKMSIDPTKLSNVINKVEELANQTLEVDDTPGIAIAVFDKDTLHFSKGFGFRRAEYNEPMTSSTIFQMASVSKPICATVLAILQHKGVCSLSDHPQQYLNKLFQEDAFKDLTIKHLLNHTSGISYDGFEEMIEAYIPRKYILERLAGTPLSHEPGKHFEYNNVTYGLIEDIMVQIMKKPMLTILQQYLFDPLGMKTASIGLPSLLEAEDRFYPYMETENGQLIPAPHYSYSYYIFPASAGVNASAEDLVPLIQLYLGKYPEIMTQEDLSPLLSPTIDAKKSLEFLGMPREPLTEAWYGLGWLMLNIGNHKVVYHTGYLNGVRNFIGFMPSQGIGIILLANSERKVASKIGLEFFYLYLESMKYQT